jgi:y4mF family transcriptional regulator
MICTYVHVAVYSRSVVRISSGRELGLYLRDRRRELGMTQAQAALAAGVSQRWLSSLEAGKSTAELGLVMRTIHALRLAMEVRPAEAPPGSIDLDGLLNDLGSQA